MKLVYDKNKIKESAEQGYYDKDGLTYSASRKHKYPSKQMFIQFFEPFAKKEFKNLKGTFDIWSAHDISDEKVKIHIEIEYTPFDLRDGKKP